MLYCHSAEDHLNLSKATLLSICSCFRLHASRIGLFYIGSCGRNMDSALDTVAQLSTETHTHFQPCHYWIDSWISHWWLICCYDGSLVFVCAPACVTRSQRGFCSILKTFKGMRSSRQCTSSLSCSSFCCLCPKAWSASACHLPRAFFPGTWHRG